MAVLANAELRLAALRPLLRAAGLGTLAGPGRTRFRLAPLSRSCWAHLRPLCLFLERAVIMEQLEVGTAQRQVPRLDTRQGGPRWLWTGRVHAYLGCPRESRPRPRSRWQSRLSASSLSRSAGFRRAPAFCCPPLLHAGGSSTAHQSRGPGLDRGPPPEMWLSLGDTPPQGLRGSCGLSLPPVAPALVTSSSLISAFRPFLYPQPLEGRRPAPLYFRALRDRVHTPPKAKWPRGPCCEHSCLRGHAGTAKSARVQTPWAGAALDSGCPVFKHRRRAGLSASESERKS